MQGKNYHMKIINCLLILLVMSSFVPVSLSAQCDTDTMLDNCAANLGTFNYIKSFSVTAKTRKKAISDFSYVFSKGSTYMLILCDENVTKGEMELSLYDRQHKLIASTYDEKNSVRFSNLLYTCSATGVYYIKTSLNGTKGECAMVVLGFKND
jgi:hypothetical protein